MDDVNAALKVLCKATSGGRVFEKNTRAEVEVYVANRMREQADHGYSIWAVETDADGLIGLSGLLPTNQGPMICYAIEKSHQRKGYATEAARAVLDLACTRFDRVISTVRHCNAPSIGVAERAGMRRSDERFSDDPGLLAFIYP